MRGADLNTLSGLTSAGFFVNKLFNLGTQSHHQTLELLRKDRDYAPPVFQGSQCWQLHKNSTFLTLEDVLGLKMLKICNSDLRMNWSSHLPKRQVKTNTEGLKLFDRKATVPQSLDKKVLLLPLHLPTKRTVHFLSTTSF